MTITCCDCKASIDKSAFAKAQLKKPAEKRRCLKCAATTKESTVPGVSTPPCASPSCNKLASSFCSNCQTVGYCSRDCQRDHWASHKLICWHVDRHRGVKGSKKELRQSIRPWTRHTTAEEKDADLTQFEKTFETDIVQVAEQHKGDEDRGLVLVDVSVMHRPLSLQWYKLKDLNKPGKPYLYKGFVEEEVDGFFDQHQMYIIMGVYGGRNGIQYGRISAWNNAPLMFLNFGGRGSTYFQGPQRWGRLSDGVSHS